MIAFSGSSPGGSKYGKTSITLSRAAPAALGGAAKVAATGGVEPPSDWNSPQRAVQLLERAPIVWARRIGDSCSSPSDAGVGGVIISPGASACRFDSPEIDGDPVANAVAAKYRLVLSQGRLGGIHVRDVGGPPAISWSMFMMVLNL